MQVFTYVFNFCENEPVAVFDPNRKRNARGEQRQQDLLRAAATVFARLGYHDTTTNAIAAESGVSPATLYQFFPNKDAIASFHEAIHALLDLCMRYNREKPEFHTLVLNAPLSDDARHEKHQLGQVFVDFIAERLHRAQPALSRAERNHHGQIALLIFRGILDELTTATRTTRPRLQQAMHDAVLRYLEPLLSDSKRIKA